MNVQFINNTDGQPQYVVLPIDEYERLARLDNLDNQTAQIPQTQTDADWQEIDYEASETDEELIPHAIVSIMIKKRVSLLAAWRIYNQLTQGQVAEMLDITQANLSQIEKVDSVPQTKTKEKLAKIYGCSVAQLTES